MKKTRTRNGFDAEKRIAFLDIYIPASRTKRLRLLRQHRLSAAVAGAWAREYYGQGLRELRRLLGLPTQ